MPAPGNGPGGVQSLTTSAQPLNISTRVEVTEIGSRPPASNRGTPQRRSVPFKANSFSSTCLARWKLSLCTTMKSFRRQSRWSFSRSRGDGRLRAVPVQKGSAPGCQRAELAVVAPDFAPAFRLTQDSTQRGLIFAKKILVQTRLAFLIPKRSGFQLLRDLRMPDNAHGAWCGCHKLFLPPSGHPPGPQI